MASSKARSHKGAGKGNGRGSSSKRDEIRAALLGNKIHPRSKVIEVFGVEIELRQPTLGSILKARDLDDAEERAVEMIIRYAYVPGTDELVFEPEDKDALLGWPVGDDVMRIQNAIAEMTGIDISTAEEEVEKNPLHAQ